MIKKFYKTICCLAVSLLGLSCTPLVTDQTEFALHYYDVGNMLPGEPITLAPSYLGDAPTDFLIYVVKHNGMIYYDPRIPGTEILTPESEFYVDPTSGQFTMRNTNKLAVGTYTVSLKCKSGGIEYDYPDKITIKIVKERK